MITYILPQRTCRTVPWFDVSTVLSGTTKLNSTFESAVVLQSSRLIRHEDSAPFELGLKSGRERDFHVSTCAESKHEYHWSVSSQRSTDLTAPSMLFVSRLAANSSGLSTTKPSFSSSFFSSLLFLFLFLFAVAWLLCKQTLCRHYLLSLQPQFFSVWASNLDLLFVCFLSIQWRKKPGNGSYLTCPYLIFFLCDRKKTFSGVYYIRPSLFDMADAFLMLY